MSQPLFVRTWRFTLFITLITLVSTCIFSPSVNAQRGIILPRNPAFSKTDLKVSDGGVTLSLPNPTALQFGPDGRLYASTHKGMIYAYTIARNTETNTYYVTSTENIGLIQTIPNHNDDGTPVPVPLNERQVTGLLVVGTAQSPVLYVTSSDPRTNNNQKGGTTGDENLDTNSGIITRLTRNAQNGWEMTHLVRGLPRSEEYHSTNGMALDPVTGTLYVTSGGHTNMGTPGKNFAYTPEYALSAALLSVDLNALNALPVLVDATSGQNYVYDLPTLDDPTRPGQPDNNDPFGGNDGLNQAMLVPNSPVQIYSPGYRNAYDVVLTEETRRLYLFDNGPNVNWGGLVKNTADSNYCTNKPTDANSGTNWDQLHYITGQGYYGGHPNLVRANPDSAKLFHYVRDSMNQEVFSQEYDFTPGWSPVPFNLANPVECEYKTSGNETITNPAVDGSLTRINGSTNGMAEYTATNFDNAMKGNLLAASYNGSNHRVYRLALNAEGTAVIQKDDSLMSNFGTNPLDVTAQGDEDIFPGTIWAVSYLSNKITAFEPAGFDLCYENTPMDADVDGYTNADEIAAKSNPCSGASVPTDRDGDLVSDFSDPDDDNDTTPDLSDVFAVDSSNGMNRTVPFFYPFFNNNPGTGFFGLGFTGLMTNGTTDYLTMFDADNLTAGGAAGAFTIDEVSAGDATGVANTQQNAFQLGINVNAPFALETRMIGPFFNGGMGVGGQSQGMYIGTGDQDNYLKVALEGNSRIRVVREESGVVTGEFPFEQNVTGALLSVDYLDVGFVVDTNARTAQPRIRVNGGTWVTLGTPIALPAAWLDMTDNRGLAAGLIATSGQSGVTFPATWDYFGAEAVIIPATPTPQTPVPTGENQTPGAPTATPTEQPGIELVVNGGFEDPDLNKKAEPWKVKFGTGDKLKCNKEDKTFAYEGVCAFRFRGNTREKVKIEQTADITSLTFNAGDVLTLNGFINANHDKVKGKVQVNIRYTDGTPTDKIKFDFVRTQGYAPFTERKTLASGNIEKIKISITHRAARGKVYVDAISLTTTAANGMGGLLPLP